MAQSYSYKDPWYSFRQTQNAVSGLIDALTQVGRARQMRQEDMQSEALKLIGNGASLEDPDVQRLTQRLKPRMRETVEAAARHMGPQLDALRAKQAQDQYFRQLYAAQNEYASKFQQAQLASPQSTVEQLRPMVNQGMPAHMMSLLQAAGTPGTPMPETPMPSPQSPEFWQQFPKNVAATGIAEMGLMPGPQAAQAARISGKVERSPQEVERSIERRLQRELQERRLALSGETADRQERELQFRIEQANLRQQKGEETGSVTAKQLKDDIEDRLPAVIRIEKKRLVDGGMSEEQASAEAEARAVGIVSKAIGGLSGMVNNKRAALRSAGQRATPGEVRWMLMQEFASTYPFGSEDEVEDLFDQIFRKRLGQE